MHEFRNAVMCPGRPADLPISGCSGSLEPIATSHAIDREASLMTEMQSDLILMVAPGTNIPDLLFDLECHGIDVARWDRESGAIEAICPAEAIQHIHKEPRIQYI